MNPASGPSADPPADMPPSTPPRPEPGTVLIQSKGTKSGLPQALTGFLLLCLALAAGLRALWAGARELWYDEAISVLLSSGQRRGYKLPDKVPFEIQEVAALLRPPAEKGLGDTVETVKNLIKGVLGDPHPPLFYLSEHGWMRLFGNSEVALRSLMILLSLVAIVVAYSLGKRLLGQRGGLIFAALLGLNPFFLEHSLTLRMYAPLVLWVLVSGAALMALISPRTALRQTEEVVATRLPHKPSKTWQTLGLRALLAGAIAAGLMTQYLFTYWLFSLVALVLYLDRRRWLGHALTVGSGILLFIPWALWGTRQQIKNREDVLTQISAAGGPVQAAWQHGRDLAQTLANQLFLGHLTTGFAPVDEPIKPAAVAIGWGVIGLLVACVIGLYRRRQYRLLVIGALMGLLPLAVALAIDVLTNKYTLGFGWGRSTIVALPGCLLLVAAWLEGCTGRWRGPLTVGLLVLYLAVNGLDYVGRDRQMFHAVRAALPASESPSLVVLNTRAWGHVLRLAYYLEAAENTQVLATNAADVPAALTKALANKSYDHVLWLRAEKPLWKGPQTPQEAQKLSSETEAVLSNRYRLLSDQALHGTMDLDAFHLQVYEAANGDNPA